MTKKRRSPEGPELGSNACSDRLKLDQHEPCVQAQLAIPRALKHHVVGIDRALLVGTRRRRQSRAVEPAQESQQ
jgi:hypothetical protein